MGRHRLRVVPFHALFRPRSRRGRCDKAVVRVARCLPGSSVRVNPAWLPEVLDVLAPARRIISLLKGANLVVDIFTKTVYF